MRIYVYLVPWEIVIICNTHKDSKWNKIFVFDATHYIQLGENNPEKIALATVLQHTTQTRNCATAASKHLTI